MLTSFPLAPLLAYCSFEKTPTAAIIGFEIGAIALSLIVFAVLSRLTTRLWLRVPVMAVGVLLFEFFTAPMWHNERLGWWAYIYLDVSWILTLSWTALILMTVILVDRLLTNYPAWQRFLVYLGVLLVVVSLLEMIVVNLGIRSYAPEVLDNLTGFFVAGVPLLDMLYYTPVFTGLVIAFYKYWSFAIDDEPLIPSKQRNWWRSLFIAFAAVFLFEVMIQPMVENVNFPRWSYFFFDINVILIAAWVLMIGVSAIAIERLFMHWPLLYRFLFALGIAGSLLLPLEAWLIRNGYRVYGASATHNFTGFTIPTLSVPIEVALAIPCYLALIIAFIRYWETVLDNRL
ncbi:MAG: hypothetical protein HC838_08305 [Spirulinaceae cyanobacterium RM2_2_10]|nr:hypothetical protein [Spirulinaceae cyanobacterium SM2_1_0]NJO20048.1 hypothetical protein [Spirulinaceae cyanobacterium RM2_2_10]